MRAFGSLVGAAVVAGAGLAYYVYQRRAHTGASYLDVIKQLPGEVQRVGEEARRRATEAVAQGKAAARRREAELVRRLEAAGPTPATAAAGATPAAAEPSAFADIAAPAVSETGLSAS